MMRIILSALAMFGVLSSTSAFAQVNCAECLQYWNRLTDQVWSCSSPLNPSGGQYGIITNDILPSKYEYLRCSSAKWCAAPCQPETTIANWWQ